MSKAVTIGEYLRPEDHARFLDWMILYRGVPVGHAKELMVFDWDLMTERHALVVEWHAWKSDVYTAGHDAQAR